MVTRDIKLKIHEEADMFTPFDPEQKLLSEDVAAYLVRYGHLPANFLTKDEARELGWDSQRGNLGEVAPGMSIGGDRFQNYERYLPKVKGRIYYEADCCYTGGKRNDKRIVYSSDGHVWYTDDHYATFTELFPSKEE